MTREGTNPGGGPSGAAAVGKASRRLLPVLFVIYIIAYLDRANVAFAKQPMSGDLGFTEEVFGFGAGIFFLGYFLLEIPGALIAEHWSARLWMSRIMLTWGALAMAEGFISTPGQFYGVRFFLGLAEAGFFPAAIVYLSHWFPSSTRAKALSGFILAVPLSFLLGAPLSAWCLTLDWFGWPGWRWLFILQGAPAVLLGGLVPFLLPDRPRDAKWLTRQERQWLEAELEQERHSRRVHSASRVMDALRSPTVWLLAATLFLIVVGNYGFVLWLPARLERASGAGTIAATLFSSIPFLCALAGVWWMGRSSDARAERRWHTAGPLLMCAAIFPLTLAEQPFALYLFWSSIVGLGLWAWAPSYWSLPTLIMGETAAAFSVGLINCIGNLGGFFGPWLIGWLAGRGSGWAEGVSAISFAAAALIVLALELPRPREQRQQHSPDLAALRDGNP